jgi:hypothetical protein
MKYADGWSTVYEQVMPMKRRGVLFLVLCAMIGNATAMFARLTDEELVEKSEMIVVGELIGRELIGASPNARTLGVIRIEQTLKGAPTATIAFLALPPAMALQKSDDIMHRDGQRGLWFLRAGSDRGVYVADHPQRFVPMDQADVQIDAVRERLAQ